MSTEDLLDVISQEVNLAEHVEVKSAELENGILTISLVKNIPEAMKPKTIEIK